MYFLGLKVAWIISKGKYVLVLLHDTDMLDSIDMLDSAPINTPMVPKPSSSPTNQPFDDSASIPYYWIIGKLIYLTTIRPDIIFTIHYLSQFLLNPTTFHQ